MHSVSRSSYTEVLVCYNATRNAVVLLLGAGKEVKSEEFLRRLATEKHNEDPGSLDASNLHKTDARLPAHHDES